MCGRFSLTVDEQQINILFELSGANAPYVPRYNGAPTQLLPVITNQLPRHMQLFRWGLIPNWSKEVSKIPLINAKSETMNQKPSFSDGFKLRRCLVPADGFYEWVHSGRKLPYRFTLNDESLFAFAGIWDCWRSPKDENINSFAILTTEANEMMAPIHDRMPVVLDKTQFNDWLEEKDDKKVMTMLKPYPSERMKMYRVTEMVNKATSEGPELIVPCKSDDFFNGELF
jgi:putative SOS response-associated peptidase YedK